MAFSTLSSIVDNGCSVVQDLISLEIRLDRRYCHEHQYPHVCNIEGLTYGQAADCPSAIIGIRRAKETERLDLGEEAKVLGMMPKGSLR